MKHPESSFLRRLPNAQNTLEIQRAQAGSFFDIFVIFALSKHIDFGSFFSEPTVFVNSAIPGDMSHSQTGFRSPMSAISHGFWSVVS